MKRLLLSLFIAHQLVAIGVTEEEIRSACEAIEQENSMYVLRNAITKNDFKTVLQDWDVLTSVDEHFSHEIDPLLPVTNQKFSGRCWMYASLNMLRPAVARKFGLSDFEFSTSYLFFFDKIERSRYFLDQMEALANEDLKAPKVWATLMSPLSGDGGDWHIFCNLVRKYGLVPKSAFPENRACCFSSDMNTLLELCLKKGGKVVRTKVRNGASVEEIEAAKQKIMGVVYKIMVAHMGTPPRSFTWRVKSKDGKVTEFKDTTPQEFARGMVRFSPDEYIVLMNIPKDRFSDHVCYVKPFESLMTGGRPWTAVQVPMQEINETAKKIVCDGHPVWFSANVLQQMGGWLMHPKLIDYERIFGMDFYLKKGDCISYQQGRVAHVMTIVGADIHDNHVTKWKVENSWGSEAGKNGFYTMMPDWFDQFAYYVVVPKKYVRASTLKAAKEKPVVLDWKETVY